MTKIIKNIHSYFCSAPIYKSLWGMRKQQMYPFALEKWQKSIAIPQLCKKEQISNLFQYANAPQPVLFLLL